MDIIGLVALLRQREEVLWEAFAKTWPLGVPKAGAWMVCQGALSQGETWALGDQGKRKRLWLTGGHGELGTAPLSLSPC